MSKNIGKAFLETLLATERMPEQDLIAHQGELLSALYRHAIEQVEFYRGRPTSPASFDATSAFWSDQPFLTREQLAGGPSQFCALIVPESHGEVLRVSTGGSTGLPLSRLVTSLESLARTIGFYRALIAWNYNFGYPFMLIRAEGFAKYFEAETDRRDWQLPEYFGHAEPSPQYFLDIRSAPSEQLARLVDIAPANINTLPSNLLRLAFEARRQNRRPLVPMVTSVSEYLAPEIRSLAHETFGCRIMDVISSAEGGVIAIECPDSHLYHIQSELVLAEILGADGQPCQAGEIGELVVTPLYNYASPILRYRSGDYVECGGPCSCGRTLPTISRFIGRREHMFTFSDGQHALPEIDRVKITEFAGHDAWVFVQTGRQRAELRVAHLDNAQSVVGLRELLTEQTDGRFEVCVKPVDCLPLTEGAKRHFTLNELIG